jgi:hypothetical protein
LRLLDTDSSAHQLEHRVRRNKRKPHRGPSLCRGADRRGMHTAARPAVVPAHRCGARAYGRLVATERDGHPDSIAEAFRRRITVLELQQIIGRGRRATADHRPRPRPLAHRRQPAARAGADRCCARHAGRGTCTSTMRICTLRMLLQARAASLPSIPGTQHYRQRLSLQRRLYRA